MGTKALPFLPFMIVGFFYFALLTCMTWLLLLSVIIEFFWFLLVDERSDPSIDLNETWELTAEDLKMPSPFYVDRKLFGSLFIWLNKTFEDFFFFTNFLFLMVLGLASGVLSVS